MSDMNSGGSVDRYAGIVTEYFVSTLLCVDTLIARKNSLVEPFTSSIEKHWKANGSAKTVSST
ncbi:MAG: hypothetical protein QNK32_05285 [Porticoccus sp.]|nr:hypothetical protein [Porticoccus sp.]